MIAASSAGATAGRGGIGRGGIDRAGTDGAGFGAGWRSAGTGCGRGGLRSLGPERLRGAGRGPGLETRDLGILGAHHRGEVADDPAEEAELDGQLLDLRPQRGLGGLGPRLGGRGGGGRLDLEQAPGQKIDLAGQLLAARLEGGDTGQGETARRGGHGTERQGAPERQEHRERPEHDEPEKADRQQPRVPAEDRDHRLNTCQERAPAAGGHPERTPPGANRIAGSLAARTPSGKAQGPRWCADAC
ncbi:hypothetical protein [Methylobacterium radiotolerans]|uniref:hypothetical protein n=1 Tax=Methylobacterium radiotolerans TaxID=31998 RepID=UPI002F35C436